jgi:transposase InsO family protein
MDNATIESFNGSFRDECSNVNCFFSMEDAREKIEKWRRDYNEFRPHSALGTCLRTSSLIISEKACKAKKLHLWLDQFLGEAQC